MDFTSSSSSLLKPAKSSLIAPSQDNRVRVSDVFCTFETTQSKSNRSRNRPEPLLAKEDHRKRIFWQMSSQCLVPCLNDVADHQTIKHALLPDRFRVKQFSNNFSNFLNFLLAVIRFSARTIPYKSTETRISFYTGV